MQCHAWAVFRQRCRQEQQQTHDTRTGASVMFLGSVQALCPDTIPAPMMERYSPLSPPAWASAPADHENVIMRRMEGAERQKAYYRVSMVFSGFCITPITP